MKNRNLKPLAALGLSACLLVGGTLPCFAAGDAPDPTACVHEWVYTEDWKTNCVDVDYTIRNADGTTQTVTLCPTCGKVGGKETGKELLKKVEGCFSNYSDLSVLQGTLENGMEVLTVAYYYPEHTETISCQKCGEIKETHHTDDDMPENPMTASIEIPVEIAQGYTLMRVNADGTETPLEVSLGQKKAFFSLTLDSGACMIHLVKN